MNLADILDWLHSDLTERTEKSNPESSTGKGKEKVKSTKSKVPVFKSISDAIKKNSYGKIFTTKSANRLYVVTRPTWGQKSRAGGNTKVAKGFSYSPAFSKVKGYADRTKSKHGGGKKSKKKE